MKGGLDTLRKVLTILPVVQANQGIRVGELARITGISEEEIVTELPDIVNLCGVPPYSPADLVDLEIEGDRVTIRFADQFRRPVRLTLREALALDMALSGLEEEAESPFARAVAGIRAKVRGALAPEVAAELDQAADRISAVSGPGRATDRVARIKSAMERQVELVIDYFSQSSGTLGERTFRPYGLYEQSGHYYAVGWSDPPGRVVTIRADRIRAARSGSEEYEIPDEFDVADYRRDEPPEPREEAFTARIRFEPDRARFARELFPARDMTEEADGGVVAVLRSRSTFWLVSELLRWGAGATVMEPARLRDDLVRAAKETLEMYGRTG